MGAGAGRTGTAGGRGGGGGGSGGSGGGGNLLSATQAVNDVTEEQIMANMAKNGVNLRAWDSMRGMTRGEALSGALSEYTGDNYRGMKTDNRLKYMFDHTDSSVKVNGTKLYRGASIDAETVRNYKPGQVIQERGISSWSRDYMVANSFAKTNQTPVIFVESGRGSKNAISIERISLLQEKEVMYAPNQKFRIQSVSHTDITNKYGSTKRVTVVEVAEV